MQITESTKRKYFSKSEKISILNQIESSEMTINQIARMYNIHPMTIYKWKRKMHIIEDSLENLSAVLLENRTLKEENKIIKKNLKQGKLKIRKK